MTLLQLLEKSVDLWSVCYIWLISVVNETNPCFSSQILPALEELCFWNSHRKLDLFAGLELNMFKGKNKKKLKI